MKVIGYLRVSTEEQLNSGHGLAAQRETLRRHAELRGWDVQYVEDAASGKDTNRPGLTYALALLKSGEVSGLVATHLDRLSRSVLDFADLLQRAREEGWNLTVLDLNLDLAAPQGEFVAHILAAVAQLERRLISERTKAALAAARTKGITTGPKPRPIPPATLDRVTTLFERGDTLTEIAHTLTTERVPLPSGKIGYWQPAQVRRVLSRAREQV